MLDGTFRLLIVHFQERVLLYYSLQRAKRAKPQSVGGFCKVYRLILFSRTPVHQEDCSQQDSAPDELAQRSADLDDLDDLDIEVEGMEEEGLRDGMSAIPHYLSQSRSLIRLSRIDTHKVRRTSYSQFYCLIF